jgi:DHA1 family tetracycline resistance protein-like MFS transporter
MYLGLACGTLGFLSMALAPSAIWFWAGLPVFALMGLFNPGLQSVMTQRVLPTEQGRLQGANTSIIGIAGMIAPGLFTASFAWSIAPGSDWHLPGAPFLIAALLTSAALIAIWRQTRSIATPPATT